MNRRPLLPLALSALLFAAGCGSKDATSDAGVSASTSAAPSNSSSGSTAVKSAPDASAAPGAAYRIQPADPSDPKYKADPRLAGGG